MRLRQHNYVIPVMVRKPILLLACGHAKCRIQHSAAPLDPYAVEVLEPGLLTTVQDYPGRVAMWSVGVPPSGKYLEPAAPAPAGWQACSWLCSCAFSILN